MKPAIEIDAAVLVAGVASGPALVLDDTLSFWGGFDPHDGRIIDVHHPQHGEAVGGRVLFVPRSKGSAGTPGGIAETLRNGSGPLAFVLGDRDVNIGVGVMVANRLYGLEIPVLQLEPRQMSEIRSGDRVTITREGVLSVLREG